jgi:hypothetical protein
VGFAAFVAFAGGFATGFGDGFAAAFTGFASFVAFAGDADGAGGSGFVTATFAAVTAFGVAAAVVAAVVFEGVLLDAKGTAALGVVAAGAGGFGGTAAAAGAGAVVVVVVLAGAAGFGAAATGGLAAAVGLVEDGLETSGRIFAIAARSAAFSAALRRAITLGSMDGWTIVTRGVSGLIGMDLALSVFPPRAGALPVLPSPSAVAAASWVATRSKRLGRSGLSIFSRSSSAVSRIGERTMFVKRTISPMER